MKPHIKLAEAQTPEGKCLTLHVHDGAYSLRLNGRDLMHSAVAASEIHLGQLAAERIGGAAPAKVLIGGLGLGFTLQSVLAAAGPNVQVVVAELLPVVVEWNRTHLKTLNGHLLDDPRVEVRVANVCAVLGQARPGEYDAVLLDIDNGPTAMVQAGNARLYDTRGIQRIMRAGARRSGPPASMRRLRRVCSASRAISPPFPPGCTAPPNAAPTRFTWRTNRKSPLPVSARLVSLPLLHGLRLVKRSCRRV